MKFGKLPWEGKVSHQTNASFSDFLNIDNEVGICSVLSDDKLMNAVLSNDEDNDDDESDIEEVPRRHCYRSVGRTLGTGGLVSSKMLVP